MTGLFGLLTRRFAQPPAILPRPRLRFEGTEPVGQGFYEEVRESVSLAVNRSRATPRVSPRSDQPRDRIAARALGDTPKRRSPTDDPPASQNAERPQPSYGDRPRTTAPAAQDPPPHDGPTGPAHIVTQTVTKATTPPASETAPAAHLDWQHSAMPPVAHAEAGPAPQLIATPVAVIRTTPAPQPARERSAPVEPVAAPLDPPAVPRVEIHIGRIEIAAPKPAAPREQAPAAQPARPALARSSTPARPGLTGYLGWKR